MNPVLPLKATIDTPERKVYSERLDNEHALGARAVHLIEAHTHDVLTEKPTESHDALMQTLLVGGLTDDAVKLMGYGYFGDRADTQLGTEDIPAFIRMQYNDIRERYLRAAIKPDSVAEWLRTRPEQAANVVQSYVHGREELQSDPEILERIDRHKQLWFREAENAVAEGWVVPDEDRIHIVNNLTFVIGDAYDLDYQNRAGYADSRGNYVSVPRREPIDGIYDIHEFNHAWFGNFNDVWITEAVTEVTSKIFRGRTTVDQWASSSAIDGEGLYPEAIKLMRAVLEMTGGHVRFEDIAKLNSDLTYSIDERTEVLHEMIDEGLRKAGSSRPPGFMKRLNDGLEKRTAELELQYRLDDIRANAFGDACAEAYIHFASLAA